MISIHVDQAVVVLIAVLKKSFLQNSYFSTLFSHAYQEFTFFECFFFQTKLLLTCMYVAWFFLTNYQKNKKRQKYQL